MSPLNHLKLGLAAIGLILWAYGARVEDERLRWIGIAFLAVAAVLRFWRRRPSSPEDSSDER